MLRFVFFLWYCRFGPQNRWLRRCKEQMKFHAFDASRQTELELIWWIYWYADHSGVAFFVQRDPKEFYSPTEMWITRTMKRPVMEWHNNILLEVQQFTGSSLRILTAIYRGWSRYDISSHLSEEFPVDDLHKVFLVSFLRKRKWLGENGSRALGADTSENAAIELGTWLLQLVKHFRFGSRWV